MSSRRAPAPLDGSGALPVRAVSSPRGSLRTQWATNLSRLEPRLGRLGAILVGVGAASAAMVLKVVLSEWIEEPGYILLVLGVLLASWFAGVPAGLAAILASLLFNAIFFLEPIWALGVAQQQELLRSLLFVIATVPASLLLGSRRTARDRLADALMESAALADELARRDAWLEWVLAASGTGYWEWDLRSRRLTWSDEIYRLHGLDLGSPPPRPHAYLGLLEHEDAAHLRAAIRDALIGRETLEAEYRFHLPDGTVRWMEVTGRVTRDASGRVVNLSGTATDVTQRHHIIEEGERLLEEERQARIFREAFIDVVSHELRTPITAIMGLTELLARSGLPDDRAARTELLEDVRLETERLHRLVEDLLVLSRAERGKLEVDVEPLEIRRLLQRVVSQEAMKLPSISLELDAQPGLPIVSGDVTYVEQVLRNLLSNAAKYTPAGTRVLVSARLEGDGVAVRVEDEGPGLAVGSEERIFELFYRSPDMARKASGSGIGLFVCASLVEAMGGRMWARTRSPGGAEFGFLLRVLAADE